MELPELGCDIFFIFLIGNTEPDGMGGEHFHLEAGGVHQRIDQRGQETYLLKGITGRILQENNQIYDTRIAEGGSKTPQVHGDQSVGIEDDTFGIVMNVADCSVREWKNAVRFGNFDKMTGGVS